MIDNQQDCGHHKVSLKRSIGGQTQTSKIELLAVKRNTFQEPPCFEPNIDHHLLTTTTPFTKFKPATNRAEMIPQINEQS